MDIPNLWWNSIDKKNKTKQNKKTFKRRRWFVVVCVLFVYPNAIGEPYQLVIDILGWVEFLFVFIYKCWMIWNSSGLLQCTRPTFWMKSTVSIIMRQADGNRNVAPPTSALAFVVVNDGSILETTTSDLNLFSSIYFRELSWQIVDAMTTHRENKKKKNSADFFYTRQERIDATRLPYQKKKFSFFSF